ncbi:hypothetical protein POX_h09637 [Penicillium oxalicum]|uniref:hypothetical protein n=1 Tax=Penicillium oxalicum TaxID=69781 RepID=UPI0020B88AF2|nr:hypothetical protein POX_h09637 [Penicillium oxalicum]KAI2785875.1 hypothetical protein POX_h09637 [Penicillium oxalicum]
MSSDIDTSIIPGTVTLVDVNHVLLHTRHLDHGDRDIVLIPTPSQDPDDPLNWSPKRKLLSTVCVSVPYASTNAQWIARSNIMGFFLAPIEALPEVTVTDVYFTHERGSYMGLYAFFLAGSNFFAPVICGFIAEHQGWRWVFYWPSIFLACAMIFLFFSMEETNYVRQHVENTALHAGATDSAGVEKSIDDNVPPKSHGLSDAEKGLPMLNESVSSSGVSAGDHAEGEVFRKKTYVQKLSLWGPKQSQNTMLRRVWQTLYYLSWPVIFFAGFSYGSYLVLFNILNGTASIILGSAPYNFSSSMVGVSYIACCLGVTIGSLFTGRFSDWLTVKLARRNNGIMEAEHRLWPYLACLVLVPGSLLLWGVGAAHEIHWFGLIVAMAMLACTNTCGVTLSVNYLVDSYGEVSGIAMASVILVRNTMSFVIGYGITPWIQNMGYQNCFISAAFVGMACASVFLVMIRYGKSCRIRSREKYWQIVRENREKGMH